MIRRRPPSDESGHEETISHTPDDSLRLIRAASSDTDPNQQLASLHSHGSSERYQVRSRVGSGGQGTVYEVWDEELRRRLAMKVVVEDESAQEETPLLAPETMSRFLEEAQITGQLDHPGVVPVHELGLDEAGRVYFTMRLVKGENLHEIINKVHEGAEGWTQVRALNAVLKACEACAYAHSKKVIHRDLKPSNLMVGKYGEAYVMDWGLARILDQEDLHDLRIANPDTASMHTERRSARDRGLDSPIQTLDGRVLGTPSYMPPEQAEGNVEQMGPASDVYSMGAVLYQLLSGCIPYVPATGSISPRTVLARVLDGPPTPLAKLAPDAPAELVAICEKAMSRSMGDRYQNMSDLATDLRAFLEGRVVSAYERGAWAELRKWITRNPGWALTGTTAIVLLVTVLAWALIERDRAEEEATRATHESERAGRAAAAETVARRQSDERLQEANQARRELSVSLEQERQARLRAQSFQLIASSKFEQQDDSSARASLLAAEADRLWSSTNSRTALLEAMSSCHEARTWYGHTTALVGVVSDVENKWLATASSDGAIRVWSTDDDSLISILAAAGTHRVCKAGPNRLLSATTTELTLWDVPTARPVARRRLEMATDRNVSKIFCVGDHVVMLVHGKLWIHHLSDLSLVRQIQSGKGLFFDAVPVAGTDQVAAGTSKPITELFEVSTGQSRGELAGQLRHAATQSPHVVTVDTRAKPKEKLSAARVWQLTTEGWKVSLDLPASPDEVTASRSAVLSPTGEYLARYTGVGLQLVAVATGEEVLAVPAKPTLSSRVAWSPDKRFVACTDQYDALLMDLTGNQPTRRLKGHRGYLIGIEFLDNTTLVTASQDFLAKRWSVAPMLPVTSTGTEASGLVRPADLLPDSVEVPARAHVVSDVAGATTALLLQPRDIKVFDNAGRQLCQIQGQGAQLSGDGSVVATSDGGVVRAWNARTGELKQEVTVPRARFGALQLSHNGERALYWLFGRTTVVSFTTGDILLDLSQPLLFPTLTRDGRRLVASVPGAGVMAWDVDNNADPTVVATADTNVIMTSDAGNFLLTTQVGLIRILQTATLAEVSRIEADIPQVLSVAMHEQTGHLVTHHFDESVRIWNRDGDLLSIPPARLRMGQRPSFDRSGWWMHANGWWPVKPADYFASMAARQLELRELETYDIGVAAQRLPDSLAESAELALRDLRILARQHSETSPLQSARLRARLAEWLLDFAQRLEDDKLHEQAERESLAARRIAALAADATALDWNNYAWDLLTVRESLRDAAAALQFANKAVSASRQHHFLDTLALAHFQNGDAAQALSLQTEAVAAAKGTAADAATVADLESRLSEYRAAADVRE